MRISQKARGDEESDLRRTLTIPGRTAKETMDFSSFAYVRQSEFSAAYSEANMNTERSATFHTICNAFPEDLANF
jgi:hypothetical protein